MVQLGLAGYAMAEQPDEETKEYGIQGTASKDSSAYEDEDQVVVCKNCSTLVSYHPSGSCRTHVPEH